MVREDKKQPQFPPAFYANREVESLTPEQIDDMLGSGWWRNRCSAVTFNAVAFESSCQACFSLRLPLAEFRWRKSLRKLLRKNGEVFSVQIQPYRQAEDKKQLWQRFKSEVHGWEYVHDLDHHLFGTADPSSFNTWELTLRMEGRLVAFSVFDHGRRAIYSAEAAYDPALRRFSPGLYTMLLEIEYCLEQGLHFYYPGMYLPGISMFQYKLRPGAMEFYRLREQRWVLATELQPADYLMEEAARKTAALASALGKGAFFTHTWCGGHYPREPVEGFAPNQYNYLLLVGKKKGYPERPLAMVAWDPLSSHYVLFGTSPLSEYFLNPFPSVVHTLHQQHVFLGKFPGLDELMPVLLSFLI
jgi:arginine-tRNA-protein transferase